MSRNISMADPPAWLLLRALDLGCAPVRSFDVVVFGEDVGRMARVLFRDGDVLLAISFLLRLRDEKVIDDLLSRATVATLDQQRVEVVYHWLARIMRESMSLLEFNPSDTLAEHLLPSCCAILSRLVFRLTKDDRADAIRLANVIYEKAGAKPYAGLSEHVGDLYRRLFYAMALPELVEHLPVLVALPVLPETDEWFPRPWPEPFDKFRPPESDRTPPSSMYHLSVKRLLEHARAKDTTRRRSIRRLMALDALGALTEEERAAFGEALWCHLDRHGLPADTGILAGNFMRLPYPPDRDPRSLFRAMLLSSPIPAIVDSSGGIRGISSLAVDSAKRYICMIGWASRSPLPGTDPSTPTVEWSPPELGSLVRKVAEWARENLRPERRNMVADLHDAVSAVVGRLLVPLAMQDGEVRSEALELARSLGSDGECPLVCAPVDLVDGHRKADAVHERITTALHTMNGTDDTMTAPGEAVLLWLAYADKGFVEVTPESVLAEVVTVLSSVRRPGLNAALDIMAAVVKDFPARLDSRSLGFVFRTLDYLVRGTAIPPRSPAMDEDLETVEELALLRVAAARLAFRLFQYHASRSLRVPPVLERWREVCASDLLPEVRREWAA